MTTIIGIGGVSRSGKSSLAQLLSRQMENSISLSLDDYAFPRHDLPKIKGVPDWEVPCAYDFQRLLNTIQEVRQSHRTVIVEGILVFYDPQVNSLFDRRIFLRIDKKEFLKRRSKETRWGPEPGWYLNYTWESYQRYGSQCNLPHLVLSGLKPFPMAAIQQWIEKEELVGLHSRNDYY